MTEEVKLERLKELGEIIEQSKDEQGNLSDRVKYFSFGALTAINECAESWCDGCPVRKAVGMVCSEWLRDVFEEMNGINEEESNA